jgi:hypothetical protein
MILSARRKFLKREAIRRSDLYKRVKISRENVVHAIVSVMAVKIQLSSPNGVRRSFRSPGNCMTISRVIWLGS